ncbi:MAG: hypothetical protein ACON35_00160 [Candidatus Marinamargulisbacteria bacterium]
MVYYNIMRWLLFLVMLLLTSCSKPVERLLQSPKVAIVAVQYDPSVYVIDDQTNAISDVVYSQFKGGANQVKVHELLLNEFLTDIMSRTLESTDISFVRPLKLVNTSLLYDNQSKIYYEYLLDPYDAIDINNHIFMAGLAERLNVDAVVDIRIYFGILLDNKMLWDEYKDPFENTLPSFAKQLKDGHKTSWFRTYVKFTVVDRFANVVYNEVRQVGSASDQIEVDDRDLSYDGGVSPKLFRLGLTDWLNDWVAYLPNPKDKE